MARFVAALCCVFVALMSAGNSLAEPDKANSQPQAVAPVPGEKNTDAEGEPLPAGALARLGSIRWRHGGEVVASATSRDGKRLATASVDSVAVWDLASGKNLFRFRTMSSKDRSEPFAYYSGPDVLAFSPDGKKLGIAFNNRFTGIWDLENGGTFRRIGNSHKDWYSFGTCRFTSDGKQFILVYKDFIRFWDPASGKLERQVPASYAVADISADLGKCIRIDDEGAWSLRRTSDNSLIKTFHFGEREGTALFGRDGKSVILVDHQKKKEIQVWDLATVKLRHTIPMPKAAVTGEENTLYFYCVQMSADGKVLMLGSAGDGLIHRWDLATGKELPVLGKNLRQTIALHELPDGKTLIATGADGLIHRFNMRTSRELADPGGYQGSPRAVVAPDGRLAAVGDLSGRVDLWDIKAIQRKRTLRSEGLAVTALAFAADGKTLAVGLENESVSLYDVASGREGKTISFKKKDRKAELDDFDFPLMLLRFSPDGRFLCVNSGEAELLMWDLARGEVRWRTGMEEEAVSLDAAFSPDGKWLAHTADDPGTVQVLLRDALTGKRRRSATLAEKKILGVTNDIASLVFAPDGRHLAVALGDGTIALLETHRLKEVKRLTADGVLGGLAFSSDGRLLAAGVMESVCVWDTATGKRAFRLEGHQGSVTTVAFADDGKTLLSCGDDSQVYLWSLRPTG